VEMGRRGVPTRRQLQSLAELSAYLQLALAPSSAFSDQSSSPSSSCASLVMLGLLSMASYLSTRISNAHVTDSQP
jgi:hypothetical protein